MFLLIKALGSLGCIVNIKFFIFLLPFVIFSPDVFTQEKISDKPEWQAFFDKHQATGTILIVDGRGSTEKVSVYDRARANQCYSPASTNKIPHTLFALDAGIVKDAFQVFPWDGVKRE